MELIQSRYRISQDSLQFHDRKLFARRRRVQWIALPSGRICEQAGRKLPQPANGCKPRGVLALNRICFLLQAAGKFSTAHEVCVMVLRVRVP